MIKTILEYLSHASTWKGLLSLATAAGVAISPELSAAIIPFGLSLIGFIQVFIDDRK